VPHIFPLPVMVRKYLIVALIVNGFFKENPMPYFLGLWHDLELPSRTVDVYQRLGCNIGATQS